MEQPVVNVGLIGYGMAGQVFHAPTINAIPGLQLLEVVERSGEKSRARYPWVKVVQDVDEMLSNPQIDLVIVATPNATHFDFAGQALRAGKHVLVEKPFTVTSAEAAALIALAREKGKLLSVYQNRRWDGDFLTVKQVVDNRLLGKIVDYEAHYDRFINYIRPSTWKEKEGPGSGILYDLGSHLIDQVQVLFGLPQTVTADIRTQRENSDIADSFTLLMSYKNSINVTLKAGMLVREAGPRYALHGTQGSFVKYGIDPQEEALKQGLTPGATPAWGVEAAGKWGILNSSLNGLHFEGRIETIPGDYLAFYRNIYAAIVNGVELNVKPEEARNTIRIIEAAQESQALGRTVKLLEIN